MANARPRADSDSSLFLHSWDFYSSGGAHLTIIEQCFDQTELPAISPIEPVRRRRSNHRKRVSKGIDDTEESFSRSELAESEEDHVVVLDLSAEIPEDSGDDSHEVVGPIHPRKNQDIRAKYKEITYITNAEGRRIIEAATLDQLMQAFAEETQDMSSIQRLVLVHEQFIEPEDLWTRFVQYFKKSSDNQVVQFRVINIIKKWIEVNYESFLERPALQKLLENFMHDLQQMSPQLNGYLAKTLAMVQSGHSEAAEPSGPAHAPHKPKKRRKGEPYELMDFEPEEVARQLTLIDWKLASEVKLRELLRCRWIKNESPILLAASNRVNDVAYWIAYQIVSTKSLKKRVQMLIQVIKVAKHLILMNNFNSLMAIYLACNFASVARLTQTWKAVPTKHFQMYQKICQLMSPRHNFKAYRTFIEDKQPPMVLCQEVFLKDLLYQEDGRDNYLVDDVLDMGKMDEIGRAIELFRQRQQKPYPFVRLEGTDEFFVNIPHDITVEKLDAASQLIEPGSINFNLAGGFTDTLRPRTPASGPSTPLMGTLSGSEDASTHMSSSLPSASSSPGPDTPTTRKQKPKK